MVSCESDFVSNMATLEAFASLMARLCSDKVVICGAAYLQRRRVKKTKIVVSN
jgi:hypothetical protein